ncbi:Membrane-bound lytic murein transglycosylase C [subsurface metagenome]
MAARIKIKTKYDDLIKDISRKYGNNPQLIKALIKIESNFNPNAHRVTSKEDSRGLGQINKPTAIALGVINLNYLFDPAYNIDIMNRLLLDLKKRYTSTTDIIAAYNAGTVRKTKQGIYINSSYVLNVYSRFLAYSVLDI